MVKLSIVIPAYNEESRIASTLNEYIGFFNKNYNKKYEIVVVPNYCSDNTASIVSKIAKKFKQVKIKEINHYVGKSGAIIEGFKATNGELVGFVDADNSAPPESLYKLIQEIKQFDGAIGSRWVKGADIKLKQPISRRIFSRSFNILVRAILNLNYRDTQCGCKVFKADQINKIIPMLSKAQWAFDVDLLYQLKKINSKIVEIPVKWTDDPRTHLNIRSAPLQMFLALVRLRLIHSPLKIVIRFYDKLPFKWKH